MKDNNNSIMLSLSSLCEILKDHNKRFTQSSCELNLSVGTTIKSPHEPEVHTHMINPIMKLLNSLNTPSSISEIHISLFSALETSV